MYYNSNRNGHATFIIVNAVISKCVTPVVPNPPGHGPAPVCESFGTGVKYMVFRVFIFNSVSLGLFLCDINKCSFRKNK